MREFQMRHGLPTPPVQRPTDTTIAAAVMIGWIIFSVLIGIAVGAWLVGP